jgi:hypothetical protein
MHPDDPSLQVSHETLYTAIYAHPRGELRTQLIACLPSSTLPRRFPVAEKWLRKSEQVR